MSGIEPAMPLSSRIKGLVPRPIARDVKIRRSHLFESFGSARYAFPALNDIDRKMIEVLGPQPGVFLEIGANDGYSQSNTYYLERFLGWRGILIEPLPKLYRVCKRIRPQSKCFNLACVGVSGPQTLELEDRNLTTVVLGLQDPGEESLRLSGGRRVTVPAAPMSKVIDLAGEPMIDFMSIDVEGAEFAVLDGLDLSRHVPRFLLVETRHPDRLTKLVGSVMEPVDQLSYHDYLFHSKFSSKDEEAHRENSFIR